MKVERPAAPAKSLLFEPHELTCLGERGNAVSSNDNKERPKDSNKSKKAQNSQNGISGISMVIVLNSYDLKTC